MLSLYVEQRSLDGHGSVSWDLAHHMYARSMCGKIAVVAQDPKGLMASVRRQWLRVMRQAQKERSRTLDASRIMELTNQIARMQRMSFGFDLYDGLLDNDVTFATAEDFVAVPPLCPTIYVTYEVGKEDLYLLTSWMPANGLVVSYEPIGSVGAYH